LGAENKCDVPRQSISVYKNSKGDHCTLWAKSPKRQYEGVRFCKIRHSKYSVVKNTPTDCFFGDFAHWAWEWH